MKCGCILALLVVLPVGSGCPVATETECGIPGPCLTTDHLPEGLQRTPEDRKPLFEAGRAWVRDLYRRFMQPSSDPCEQQEVQPVVTHLTPFAWSLLTGPAQPLCAQPGN